MSDSAGEQVATLKINDGQYGVRSSAAATPAGAAATPSLSSSWWGPWQRSATTPQRFTVSKPHQSTQQWLKQSLLACCCAPSTARANAAASHVRTRRSPGGVLRKYEDLELHRRRSTAVLLDAPNSSDSGKVLSFGRARNSGVNRLLRSNTSSCSSGGRPSLPTSTANYASAHDIAPSTARPLSAPAASSTLGDVSALDRTAAPPVPLALSPRNGHTHGASSASQDVAVTAAPHSDDPASNSSFHSAIDDEHALVVSEYQGHVFPDHVWSHVVLKMTAFTDDDVVTSFRFSTDGGTIGRDSANTASVPADKLMKKHAHAKILYAHGGFYLQNCDESSSGTFVRLGPCADDSDIDNDDDGGRMQWPLDPHVAFRAGKSDFVVTKFNEIEQTLELEALSGKLQGSVFTITTDGAGIGRSADNEIHAGDGELSRKHAAIWFDDLTHKFYLIDLGSTNGTFMKLVGPYNEPYRLEIGDDLLLSQTCLTVNRFDFGVHANMGTRKYMEDAHTIIQDLNIESLSCLGLHPQSFFAVYDGHGGAEASSFLGDTLHHNVIDEFRFKKKQFDPLLQLPRDEIYAMVRQRLVSAFEKTDEEFLRESERPQAGSTATTVFIAGDQLFVANVGDSRTVLSRKRVAMRLSNDHKPSRVDEAQRIRDTGGFVIHGRIMGELAVSRAFGDSPFKTFDVPEPVKAPTGGDSGTRASGSDATKPRSEYDSQELPVNPNDILKGPLVIATPEITTTTLTDDDEFLLLASDGLFDVLKDQDAVDFLRQKMLELQDVQRAVEALVEHAIFSQRSTDNVTAVVIMFQEPKDLARSV